MAGSWPTCTPSTAHSMRSRRSLTWMTGGSTIMARSRSMTVRIDCSTAYATDAAAAAAQAAQPSVTIQLIFTGDQMMQRIDNDIVEPPVTRGVRVA